MHTPAQHSSWHRLFRLAAPYRGRFVVIALLAALATGAELKRLEHQSSSERDEY
jgi:hypothetical protein